MIAYCQTDRESTLKRTELQQQLLYSSCMKLKSDRSEQNKTPSPQPSLGARSPIRGQALAENLRVELPLRVELRKF